MREEKGFFTILGLLLLIWFIGMLLPTIPLSSAANNQTVSTKVNVSMTEPHVVNVTITPSPISLNPGTTLNVTCNGTVWSYNGVPEAITAVTAVFFLNGSTGLDNPRNDSVYTANCTNVSSLTTTTGIYSCSWEVWYFARNGTWICNMTPYNAIGLNTSNISSVTVQSFIALNVTDQIDYGIVPVLNTSDERVANVTNFGNSDLNISVRGWGGDNETLYPNLSMNCELGNISIDMERYNITSGMAWTSMFNLTGTNTLINGLRVSTRNDTFRPINSTYWRIRIPAGVGGICNGTILFTAGSV